MRVKVNQCAVEKVNASLLKYGQRSINFEGIVLILVILSYLYLVIKYSYMFKCCWMHSHVY